jgi:putative heme iron utilization protein
MTDPFSAAVSERICKHMNEDHSDAVALYAKAFGGVTNATHAEMLSIDADGMNLDAQADGATIPLRIQFEPALQDAEDAHHRLIAMIKQARTHP